MLGTRYEEHTHFTNKLPFKLIENIKITPATKRSEANWHENLELKLCTKGSGTVMIDEKHVPFKENDIVLLNSNVLHHTNSDKMVEYTALIIDPNFCRQVAIDPLLLKFSSEIKDKSFFNLFKKLIWVYSNKSDPLCTAKSYELLLKILIELREKHTILENTEALHSHTFEAVKGAIKYIRENYHKKITLEKISKVVYMDKYVLSREFKKVTTKTIVEYINDYRCQKAANLISDGITVTEAATQCGFSNMSFFTKTFKAHMNKLPSEFKNGLSH